MIWKTSEKENETEIHIIINNGRPLKQTTTSER
jgi:hypothetical protein